MTDQEINEAVARKLGWSKFDLFGCAIPPGKKNRAPVPRWSTSISAAWEIMEKLPVAVIAKLNNGWACNPDPPGFDLLVKADTAPMAICLAFLKLEG